MDIKKAERRVAAWRRGENCKLDPKQRYLCRGGPFEGGHIYLTASGDGHSTLFHCGPFVGRYRVLSQGNVKHGKPGVVEWVEDV